KFMQITIMTKLFTALFLVFFIQASAQFYYYPLPRSNKDYKRFETTGIKICYEYKISDGEKYLASILEYGSKGLPAVWYEKGTDDNGDSVTLSETTFKYNPDLTLQSTTTDDAESGSSTTHYTYNKNRQLIKKEYASIDPPTYTYKYNTNGQLAEIKVSIKIPDYDEDGNATGKSFNRPQSKMTYKYDKLNRIIEEWYYLAGENGDFSQNPDYKTKWSYNSESLVSRIEQADSEGYIISSTILEYNQSGLLISLLKKSGDETEQYKYEYCTDCKQSWMK
ncbi:MAG TPA: hypothetical protein PKC72_08185, partial [Chitinophagaceae bacterium]|nr:hypothetical protein [Chitinophagaceae bacterium]